MLKYMKFLFNIPNNFFLHKVLENYGTKNKNKGYYHLTISNITK